MDGIWGELLAFPTVVFTGLLIPVVLYWLLVIAGALDLDIIDLGGEVGGAEAADGLDGVGGGWLAALLPSAVPVTFVLSLVALFSWFLCAAGMHALGALTGSAAPGWLLGLGVGLASPILGVVLAGAAARPFARLFKTRVATSKHALVGKGCTVSTGTVDASHGQATCEDGGAGLVLAVRYEGARPLLKGARAVIVAYDPARDAFTIEPLDDLADEPVRGRVSA